MPYFAPDHLKTALSYMSERVHPQLITLLAMFRSGMKISDRDEDASAFGAREENLLLMDYFRPESGPEERPFYVPFGGGKPSSRWRDYRYAGRSLQRMRKDRHNAGIVLRQSSADNRRWTFRTSMAEDLSDRAGETVGDIPIILPMLAVWFYRTKDVESVRAATERFIDEFKLSEYGVLGSVFQPDVPSGLDNIPLQPHPMRADEILSLLEIDLSEPVRVEVSVNGEEPPGRWDIDAAELGDLCGLVGLEKAALQALAALRSGMHVIFTGPPGTGKTSLAVCLCQRAGFPSWTVSATDQWTTFDTIGGYFPSIFSGQTGEQLDFLPGHVVDSIERQKCLIIDEINRADIDKAFGEMFTLLSGQAVTLPFRRRASDGSYRRVRLMRGPALAEDDLETIEVPDWWRILGAMNDADKQSLKQLSYAFMRRFAFVAVPLPPRGEYEALLRGVATELKVVPNAIVDATVALFADKNSGFGEIGMPFGPAIPISMLRHAANRVVLEPGIASAALLCELMEAYVAPQLQGRAEIHKQVVDLLRPRLEDLSEAFSSRLGVWTGYSDAFEVD